MSTEYKPLFNRTYLKVLMVGCLFAIYWLANMNTPVERPQGQVDNQPLYWLQSTDSELPEQLVILLPTASAFSAAEQNRQHWRASILSERLQQQLGTEYPFQVQVADDYLSISIESQQQALPALDSLWDGLSAPVDASQRQAQLKQIQARRYLSNKAAEQQLLNKLGDQLGARSPRPLAWSELFSKPRFILAGDDAQERAEALSAKLPGNHQSHHPTPLSVLSGRATLELSSTQSLLLIASTLPARTEPDYVRQRLIAATSQLALQQFPVASDSQYRLQWKSLQHGGYQAVIFASTLPLNSSQLEAFGQHINAELVEQARQQLRQHWQNINETAASQLGALSLIARYQLPLDSLSQYQQQLDILNTDEIATATRARFNPQQQYSLRIDNQP